MEKKELPLLQKNCMEKNKGTLYLVGTPIGNLSDITLRAIEVLKSVNIIYCEDTRVSIKLLTHYGIKTTLLTYHKEKMVFKLDEIVGHLNSGKDIAIISDAGLPLISDPGYEIVTYCKENDISVVPIGGVTSYTLALISSGLPITPSVFLGFLPRKENEIKKELLTYDNIKGTFIILESPNRVIKTLEIIYEVFGNVKASFAREITKKYEEIKTDNILNLIDILKSKDEIKGEFVLLFYKDIQEQTEKGDPIFVYNNYLKLGLLPQEALKVTALKLNINKKDLYSLVHKNNKK